MSIDPYHRNHALGDSKNNEGILSVSISSCYNSYSLSCVCNRVVIFMKFGDFSDPGDVSIQDLTPYSSQLS